MKTYDIKIIKDDRAKSLIIFSTNYISPLDEIEDIQKKIKNICFQFENVYFDFLMCTKNEKERYAKVSFKDGAFDFTKFKYVRIGKDDHIREISANYYRTHSDSIDWTYAGEIKRKLINNGFIV